MGYGPITLANASARAQVVDGLPEAASTAGPLEILPELRCSPLAEYTGPYAGLSLSGPTGVALAMDGARLVADTGNHRVVVLEPDGRLRTVIGGRCELAREGSCDGRFLEPWGVASGLEVASSVAPQPDLGKGARPCRPPPAACSRNRTTPIPTTTSAPKRRKSRR